MTAEEIKDLVNFSIKMGAIDQHMAETVVHDAIIEFKDRPELIKSRVYYQTKEHRRTYFRRQQRHYTEPIEEVHQLMQDSTEYRNHLEKIIDDSYVATEIERDQRQLISSLISNADELTTAIVRTWLSTDKPTLTSVGRVLNINHNAVNRRLKKLAENFNEDKYGSIFDYFTA